MPTRFYQGGGMSVRLIRKETRGWLRVKRLPKKIRESTYHVVGVQTFEDSQDVVPYEFGHLKRTGRLRQTREGFTIQYLAGYATIQHENLGFQHPGIRSRSPNMARAAQGMAKYLQIPFQNNRREYIRLIKATGLI